MKPNKPKKVWVRTGSFALEGFVTRYHTCPRTGEVLTVVMTDDGFLSARPDKVYNSPTAAEEDGVLVR